MTSKETVYKVTLDEAINRFKTNMDIWENSYRKETVTVEHKGKTLLTVNREIKQTIVIKAR